MDESCEGQSEGNKALPEKNKKRIVKSRMQIEALEKLYDENKYPTESMKAQLAESLGLTEKQVSGWFCHSRLKDKRLGEACASGRQDRSSGVIQDRGSGLMQDSCGSTKQGDYVHFDAREVESRRLNGPDFSGADLNFEFDCKENHSSRDDTSSGSSSLLRDRFLRENEVSLDLEIPGHAQNEKIVPINAKVIKARNGPSGYLKVKGQVENAAITAVKRQLGRHYREDGPPLAVEFEPLALGAFESLARDPVNKPYCVGDLILVQSPDVPRIQKQPNHGTRHEVYNPKLHSRDFDLQGSDCHEDNLSHQLEQKSFLLKRDHSFSRQKPSVEMNEDSSPSESAHDSEDNYEQKSFLLKGGNSFSRNKPSVEMNEDSSPSESAHGSEDNYEMRDKHNAEEMRMDSAFSNLHPCTLKAGGEHNKVALHGYKINPDIAQREFFETSSSDPMLKWGRFLDAENGGRSILMSMTDAEEAKYYGETRSVNEHRDSSKGKIYPTNQKKVGKSTRVKYLQQQHMTKPSRVERTSTNQIKRSMAEIPSKF